MVSSDSMFPTFIDEMSLPVAATCSALQHSQRLAARCFTCPTSLAVCRLVLGPGLFFHSPQTSPSGQKKIFNGACSLFGTRTARHTDSPLDFQQSFSPIQRVTSTTMHNTHHSTTYYRIGPHRFVYVHSCIYMCSTCIKQCRNV